MRLTNGYSEVPAGKIAAVVTSLAMTAKPPPAHAFSAPPAARPRRVERPDLAWYRALFRRVGEDWLWFSRLRLADAELAAIIHDPRVEVYALDAAGQAEGLLELDFRVPGECELAFLGVSAPLAGRGAGKDLLRAALAIAWSRPIARLWVHTCTLDHPAALPLYLRAGFVPFRRQVEVADDPRLTGEAPRTAAAHVPLLG